MRVHVQMEELTAGLGPKENSTKTMGVRRTEAARVAGEGAPFLAALTVLFDGVKCCASSAWWVTLFRSSLPASDCLSSDCQS